MVVRYFRQGNIDDIHLGKINFSHNMFIHYLSFAACNQKKKTHEYRENDRESSMGTSTFLPIMRETHNSQCVILQILRNETYKPKRKRRLKMFCKNCGKELKLELYQIAELD